MHKCFTRIWKIVYKLPHEPENLYDFPLASRTPSYMWLIVPKGKRTSGTHHRLLGISNCCLSSVFPRTMSCGHHATQKLLEAESSCTLRALLQDWVLRIPIQTQYFVQEQEKKVFMGEHRGDLQRASINEHLACLRPPSCPWKAKQILCMTVCPGNIVL